MMSNLRMSSSSERSIEVGRDIEELWRVLFVRDTVK